MAANPSNRKAVKFFDTKMLIATLAVAVTIGLWNLFSLDAVQAERGTQPALSSNPPDSNAAQSQDLPPLPTLVPLVNLQEMPASNQAVMVNPAQVGSAPAQTGKLRSVAQPTVTIVQKSKPMVDALVVGGGGGGGGGGGKRSAARTRAS